MAEDYGEAVDRTNPIWFLRAALSGVGFSLLFLWMGYDDPGFQTVGYALSAGNLLLVAVLVAAYWYWPRDVDRVPADDGEAIGR